MRIFLSILAFTITVLSVSDPICADIFSYKDKKGVIHLSNSRVTRFSSRRAIKETRKSTVTVVSSREKESVIRTINRIAVKEGVDPMLVMAIAKAESSFNPRAVSPKGAVGVMQLMPGTAAQMAKAKKVTRQALFQPGLNIRLGCRYLSWLRHRLPRPEAIIAAYNAGLPAAKRWQREAGNDPLSYIETIGYEQSRKYARWVIGDYLWYRYLWPREFDNREDNNYIQWLQASQ